MILLNQASAILEVCVCVCVCVRVRVWVCVCACVMRLYLLCILTKIKMIETTTLVW